MPEPAHSRPAFRGRHIRVDEEDWPGIGPWEVVRPLDAVAVLPLTPSGDVLLVRQFRPPVRHAVLEVPAGLLDVEGEEPRDCAARELIEETGYRHRSLAPLGGVHTSVGHSSEFVHLFLAETEEQPAGSPEEDIELVRRPFRELVVQAREGRVEDAKTALALLLADARTTSG
jgi:ADP-ribose pyrophosphatase